MHNKLTILISLILLLSSVNLAQEPILETYGVSPRVADEDTTDIFTYRYNGLTNVGVGTKVYLKGSVTEGALTNPTWTLPSKPAGSNAAFGAKQDEGDNIEYIAFTPDVAGVYVIEFSDGSANVATITINAAMYLGAKAGDSNCQLCHSGAVNNQDQYNPWSQTGHADIMTRGIEGTLSSHYGENCLECHTTGYDPYAENDGFDDHSFEFPDSLYEGKFAELVEEYPEAMEFANVQCESCHGPGGNHIGVTENSRMVSSLDAANCAYCHDDGSHHVYPEQWDVSVHANPASMGYAGGRAGCANCHSGSGFVAYVKGGQQPLSEAPEPVAITCAVCHDPHDATNPAQLRLVTATLENGYEVQLGNEGRLCINCHKSRRDAVDYTDNYLDNLSSHFGPHYGTQADLLVGQNAVTWGEELPTSPHLQAIEKACVGCHMGPAVVEEGEHVALAGGHTFSMTTPDGKANVDACTDCHGDIGETFAEKKFYMSGIADHDGDGIEEGLQEEVHGLLEEILTYLPVDETGHVAITDSSITQVQAQAAFNYMMVENDGSLGMHNPEYIVSLLKLSLAKLKGVTYVRPDETGMPMEYQLSQNYPNPFNPTTTIKFSIPEHGEVRLTVYDALGKEVETLINETMSAGTYSATWNAANSASGIYFYKIEANNFVSVKKMILVK